MMTGETFDKLVAETLKKCAEIRDSKGKDYSDNDDRFSNFKVIAELLGLTPLQVWAVYYLKHVIAIMTFVKTGELASEPIESRFHDTINYDLLGSGLATEAKNEPMHKNGWQDVPPGGNVSAAVMVEKLKKILYKEPILKPDSAVSIQWCIQALGGTV